ncbi:unnamed protein product [Urochloa decumbens]|uniref:protein disulfide-isomerase n=1 Tax=Urochloa decumbens TaxID=240449 RepID=A0ABC8YY56_9POAL
MASSMLLLALLLLLASSTCSARVEASASAVLTLDADNFSEVVSAHQFIVVNFYGPWLYWSKKLAPEYEKAAAILRNHDPPIVLAKIDAISNKDLRDKYSVVGYPTVKLFWNGGSTVEQYFGERDAESIVRYLKKQVSPASTEIQSAEDTATISNDNGMGKVNDGTLESYHKPDPIPEVGNQHVKKHAPHNRHEVIFNSAEKGVRDAESIVQYLEKRVGPASTEIKSAEDAARTITDGNDKGKATAILFLRSPDERIREFMNQVLEALQQYSSKNIGFTVVDISGPQVALQYFKLKESDVPLIFIEASTATYMKPNVEPHQILPFFKEYIDGTLEPYHKSNLTPEVSDQPVKEVAANNLNDVISNSGILMASAALTLDADNISEVVAAHQFIVVDFYAPWCYWSKKLAPEYEKAAAILRNHDPPIVLAKIDASGQSKKDSRLRQKYSVQGYPTVKLFMNGGNTVQQYFGERDAESIVRYLKKQVAEDAARTVTDGNDKQGKATAIPFVRSGDERIRNFKDQPVKEVAANNLNDVILNSAKKVILEFRQRMKWAFQILVATIVEFFTKDG